MNDYNCHDQRCQPGVDIYPDIPLQSPEGTAGAGQHIVIIERAARQDQPEYEAAETIGGKQDKERDGSDVLLRYFFDRAAEIAFSPL